MTIITRSLSLSTCDSGLPARSNSGTAGTSGIGPDTRDRRFADPAWATNPVLRRIVQAYLAAGRTAEQLIADSELDWRDDQRIRFLAENLIESRNCVPSKFTEKFRRRRFDEQLFCVRVRHLRPQLPLN